MLAAGALFAFTVLHDLDHIRQGRQLPLGLEVIGAAGTLGAAVLFFGLLLRGDKIVRVAEAFGFTTMLGLVAIHVLPHWSAISDPYGEAGVDALSWVSLVAFIAAGAALGLVAHRHRQTSD